MHIFVTLQLYLIPYSHTQILFVLRIMDPLYFEDCRKKYFHRFKVNTLTILTMESPLF